MGMRRGGCARRAMLGAVAAGALLGAARGTYTIDLDNQELAGGIADDRADDEYKVVTTAGLEIVIGPKVGNEYDIGSAVPSQNDNGLDVGIAVVGGKNDDSLAIIPSNCPGGITLDASTGNIVCYDVARGPQDTSVVVTNGVIDVTGGEFTGTTNVDYDFDTDCAGDIDVKITGEIDCYSTKDGSLNDDDVIVTNTDTDATPRTLTVNGNIGDAPSSSLFDFGTSCPGGITILRGDAVSGNIVCYGVERGAALVTNTADGDDSGSIVVTETKNSEETTIAGASATITVNGGAELESLGTNYKIELNTDDGAFTETVTTIVSMKSEDDNGDLKLETVDVKTELTISGTATVTAPNDEIDDLLSGIEAPDSFAAGTVITIV